MHHQDFSGEPPGTGGRKSAYHFRRGSSGASASAAAGATTVNTDDNPAQAGSSSPALHHQAQSQVAGAQVKKKSGFQITSVTSAQINVSGNNSLADDTESYDDMDESHTEDLSSSDMLDVSVSKATDTGVPERSSSDETLNSLHGVDTPGLVSPNEPLHPHLVPQGSQSHSSMVNGSIHPPYYSQQHSQSHHHHSDSLGGGESSLPSLPIAPLASSSPAMISKGGTNQSQRPLLMDNTQSSGGTTKPLTANISAPTTDAHLQGSVNISNMSAVTAPAAPSSGSAGFDTNVSGQVTGPSAPANNSQTQHTQTQTATGSRFRVVKLDTNSEPFRKGRWTCTEYYEKEIPHATSCETPKGTEAAVETEAGNTGISQGLPTAQPPHTLQPYPPPSQDFTSPQAMQSPPQGVALTTPLTYVSPQEVTGGVHMQKPVAPIAVPTATPQGATQVGLSQPLNVLSQQLPYAADPLQAQPQGGYSATQLHAGVMTQGTVRQPDFIQPTAPFQTQVQPPLSHITTGIPVTPGPGVTGQASSVGLTQQLPHQAQVAPPVQTIFPAGQPPTIPAHAQQQHHPQTQVQPAAVPSASTQVTQGIPLTALHADLQPLLAPGATFTQIPGGGSSLKTSQLEDAQRLLLQHQSLLGLPRLGTAPGGEGCVEAHSAAGTLAHMGMSVEASAFMAVAAAGLRSQHVEGEEDR